MKDIVCELDAVMCYSIGAFGAYKIYAMLFAVVLEN